MPNIYRQPAVSPTVSSSDWTTAQHRLCLHLAALLGTDISCVLLDGKVLRQGCTDSSSSSPCDPRQHLG